VFRRMLEFRKRALRPDSPELADALSALGGPLQNSGDYREAQRLFKQAFEIRKKAFGTDAPELANDLYNLAALLGEEGRDDEAQRLLRRALKLSSGGQNWQDVARVANALSYILLEKHRYEEAEHAHRQGNRSGSAM